MSTDVEINVEADLGSLIRDGGFSGVIRTERRGEIVQELAAGFADRANQRPNTITTRFAVASAGKGLTALTIMSLVESGELELTTTLRSIAGERLPLVDQAVTIEHLLAHRSGVGDYLDESLPGDIDDYVLDASPHRFQVPSDYLRMLAGHPQVSAPGDRFAYNNGGYVMLSLVIELITGSFHDAVAERVLGPASMTGGGFFRSDALPGDTALGYLQDGRTNVFHLPVIGAGDGGIYLTLDDMTSFWDALFGGRIVSPAAVEQMTSVLSEAGDGGLGHGLGFWLYDGGRTVRLEGLDAGVSFRSAFDRVEGQGYTVISNTSSGIWPVARRIEGR